MSSAPATPRRHGSYAWSPRMRRPPNRARVGVPGRADPVRLAIHAVATSGRLAIANSVDRRAAVHDRIAVSARNGALASLARAALRARAIAASATSAAVLAPADRGATIVAVPVARPVAHGRSSGNARGG